MDDWRITRHYIDREDGMKKYEILKAIKKIVNEGVPLGLSKGVIPNSGVISDFSRAFLHNGMEYVIDLNVPIELNPVAISQPGSKDNSSNRLIHIGYLSYE